MNKIKQGLSRAGSRGFTLIELLVVVFIIGLLASLVIVNVANARKSGRDAKRVANLNSIQTALEMYNQKKGEYPTTSGWSGECIGQNPWITGLVSDGYISVLPTDPKPNTDVTNGCYIYNSNGTDYILKANGSMETCPTGGCIASENVSIKEMAIPGDATATIAVWSIKGLDLNN